MGNGNGLPIKVDWSGKACDYLIKEPFQTEGTTSTKIPEVAVYLFKKLIQETASRSLWWSKVRKK